MFSFIYVVYFFLLSQESNTRHCRKAELTVISVRETDGGEYMLVVASERGLAGASIILNVTVSTALSDVTMIGSHNGGALQSTTKFTIIFTLVFSSLFGFGFSYCRT